ncbi:MULTISPECIES: SIMPL domain-containing protein [unclassified Nocardia]|uniref:SIMPL domain-containing protein n=1 Tax=unclassified Nocardia TaxID=2637762 RepID=UPI0034138E70
MSKKKSDDTAGMVTTFGSGSARATADLMRVTISIETRASKVALAYGQAGERVAAVTDSLRSDGVPGTDIATSGLSVRTETVWLEGGGSKITGYVATTDLTVVLREIGETADPGPATIIANCVEAGGDDVRLGGLNLGFADQENLLIRARDAAWDNALAKAEQYAGRARRSLGAVLEITENATATPPTTPRLMAMSAPMNESYGGAPVPVELGESEISATIRATWQLD